MAASILRSAGSIILALVVALILVIAVEGFSAVVHPFPEGFDGTPESMKAHVANYPDWVLVVAALAWGATTFISTWVATRLGTNRHPAHGIAIGLLLLAAVIFNMSMLPYPIWFEILILILFPLGIFFAIKLGRKPQTATAS